MCNTYRMSQCIMMYYVCIIIVIITFFIPWVQCRIPITINYLFSYRNEMLVTYPIIIIHSWTWGHAKRISKQTGSYSNGLKEAKLVIIEESLLLISCAQGLQQLALRIPTRNYKAGICAYVSVCCMYVTRAVRTRALTTD